MTTPADMIVCALCGLPLPPTCFLCDETMESYCPTCFDRTPCGKGRHGEGCPTLCVSGDEPPQ